MGSRFRAQGTGQGPGKGPSKGSRMTDAIRREPGASWLSVIWSARHDPAARIFNIDLLTVLIAILLPWSTTGVAIAVVLWFVALIPTIEPRALVAVADAADLGAADRDLCAGAGWNAVVGRVVGRPASCGQPDRQTAGAAAAVLSFPALAPRRMGLHRLSGVLHAADGCVLGRGFRAQPHAQARNRGAGDLRQELHRPKPGIRAVRGGAGLSDHDLAASRPDAARAAAHGDCARSAGQHDVRGGFAHRAGDHADHAGGIRAASFASGGPPSSDRSARRVVSRRWSGAASPHLRATTRNFSPISSTTRIQNSPSRIGCGWSSGRSRCGFLRRLR